MRSAWQDILAAHAGARILIVGHAGITRMILSIALGSPPEHMFRIQVENAGMTRLRVRGRGDELFPMLEFHGRGPQ